MAQADSNRRRYEQWVRDYASELYRFAFRLSGQRQVAEDLLQETFTEAWRSLAKQHGSDRARAWLFQILRHRFAHFLRANRAISGLLVPLPENSDDQPADRRIGPLEKMAEKDALQTALQTLSPAIRETFLTVFMEGRTCRETAEVMQIPLGTVLSRLDQARRTLRIALTDRESAAGDSAAGAPVKGDSVLGESVVKGGQA
jgi:RNA polymerase sigma-70 factor (ECF subfamily)